ncbi:g_PROTEIN_RECEP_F2_3 domain-containing protein [Trichonephila clavipes]|nr:g_PROTEIN_RECEP_F2_3 domain-containing protein [Trichonephila clavipes]
MVNALKPPKQAPRVSGELLQTCVWPGIVLMEHNTSSVGQLWPFLLLSDAATSNMGVNFDYLCGFIDIFVHGPACARYEESTNSLVDPLNNQSYEADPEIQGHPAYYTFQSELYARKWIACCRAALDCCSRMLSEAFMEENDNMLTKYQMIKFIDFCEVRFLPESVARLAAIVGDYRCPTSRH